MNIHFNNQNINHRPAYMSATRPPPITTTSYIHLRPCINTKPNLYGAAQRKDCHPYRKFQTGSTTTFSGYTNVSNCFQSKPQNDNVTHINSTNNMNNRKLPSLMSLDHFQQPPRKNCRTLQHAEQYRNQAPTMIEYHANHNFRTSSTLNQLNGIILSDSMCKYVRADKVTSHGIKINLSFESGCDCNRMLDFLEKQQQMINNDMKTIDFFVFSLCTNDVANVGVDIAIERCRFLIQRTRQLFPQIKTIGWLALSPRTKPSRLYSSLDINQCYKKFNQLLYNLSNEMNFKMINANLQQQHMHQDGLHPSIESGRILIERTLYNWFAQQKNLFLSFSTLDNHSNVPFVTAKTTRPHNQTFKSTHIQRQQIYTNNHQPEMQMHHNQHNYNYHNNNVNQQNHQHQVNIKNNYIKNYQHQKNINNHNNMKNNHYHHSNIYLNNNNNHQQYSNINDNNNNDNEKNFQYLSKKNIQSNILISHYPHFLRHREEFYRKIEIPKELENKKEDIFHLTNIHYQAEYLKLEATKWKTYVIAASNKRQSKERREHMKTIIEIDDSLPIARPSPSGLVGPPAPLDLSDFAEIVDDWLPDPVPGQKRKLGHRRDDPPTPPSPRHQPPPIIPRKTLPPRNPNALLVGGSLRASPISNEITTDRKQQHSFHALLPIEKQKQNEQHIRTPNIIVPPTNEQSMTISPLQSSTPEPMIRSPSVIPKTTTETYHTFEFEIIPIECKYHFKRMKQRCTFEAIRAHQECLERQYKTLENETERVLNSMFSEYIRTQVVTFVKKTTEKVLENKKNSDKKRLDNLLMDQMREKAIQEIERTTTQSEHQHLESLHEKFMRNLELKLQLDKLEKRFLENLPPPSLNIFDKLQLHAKGLKPDDNHLSSLREQWKNVLRKTKLDLTTLMRQTKVIELEVAQKEYDELKKKLPDRYQEAEKGAHNERKLVRALSHNHPGFSKTKLHPHFTRISFPPQANNKAYILQGAEARVLNLGPKFVPPAPQQVLERLPKEIKQMQEKISTAWRRATKTIGREPPIVKTFCERIQEEIKKTVETESSKDTTIEPAIKFFQKIQRRKQAIFRQTDKSKVFHVDTRENYIKKSEKYMEKTNAYEEIAASPLRDMIEKTDKFLRELVTKKQLPQYMLEKLRPVISEAELPHLYYNPKDHKIEEPLRPIVSGMKSPLAKISSYLDQIIRPLFDKHTPYSLSNSMTFLQQIKKYETTSQTSLYTFDITDLYTMIPQREAVLAICEFLGRHGYKKVRGLSINTIKSLFLHILENSYFVLQLPGQQPKFYRQIRGGAMGSACTQVLADIYVKKWESIFVQQQQQQDEMYYRFRDDVFFSTKRSSEQIEQRLIELNEKDKNISITWQGGKAVDYLDVTINIEIPNFKTIVFRKLAAQPYVLPFHSSHPSHIKRNIPFAAALRATRICSHSEDLRKELDKIRITLLLNKYPPRFIDKHISRFLQVLTGDITANTLLGSNHEKFRENVLSPSWNKKEKKKIDFNKDILVHFSYAPSLAHFGSKFHQIWGEVFDGTPLDDIPVTYANRLTDSLKHLLVKKRPSKEALKIPSISAHITE